MQEDVISSPCTVNTTNNKTCRVATQRNSAISGQQAGYTNAINSTMALRTHHMQQHEVVTRAHPTQHLDQWRAARRSTCRTGGFSATSLEQSTSFAPSQHCALIHATVALQQLHSNEHAQCGNINTRSLLAAHHSLNSPHCTPSGNRALVKSDQGHVAGSVFTRTFTTSNNVTAQRYLAQRTW